MRSYSVHRRRRAIGDPQLETDTTLFVREGFAWWALIAPVLWLLYHWMWIVLLGFLAVAVALNAIVSAIDLPQAANIIVSAGLQILFAAEANNLRRWTLDRNGFDLVAVVLGKTVIEAELRYFRDWHAARAAPQAAHEAGDEVSIGFRTQAQEPVVGLFPSDKPA